ncbi:MAG: HAMP domain-containing sensor histidine kinase [Eubacteriales bacterium]|nr:HAMP domain-containing sensor histidine kinase [Eubacteriales bacterium]
MQNICITSGEGDIVLFKARRKTRPLLAWYLLFCVLISGAIGVAVGYACYYFGSNYVDQLSDDQEMNQVWQVRYLEELQEFVKENEITAANIAQLNEWTEKNGNVYVSIYQNRRIIFNSDNAYDMQTEQEEYDTDELEDIFADYLYRLVLFDGSIARVDIFCYDFWKYYNYIWGIAVALGIIVFDIVLTRLIHRKINYINGIVKELQILEGGNLEYPITVKGNDEITNLAMGIEQMRLSIIDNMQKEQETLRSNKELVTSMSHDLRTPLTTLTGYLEMLNMGVDLDEEKKKHYLELSLAKSMEIKQLSDDLFSYFLIYGESEKHIDVEPISANGLTEDLIHNQMLGLEESGYVVQGDNQISEEDGCCMINIKYMQRVLNNVISNLEKYADKDLPIEISACVELDKMILCVKNAINHFVEPHESTKIGLITCGRILKLHGGKFESLEEDNYFTVKIEIPMEGKEC